MANIINGTDTGSGGLITTGDSSDELQLQTAETTAVTITSGQQSAFIAGTASAPAVTTTGDLNTGIYFPAADNIGFTTGGTIRGRWTTDGLCFGADTAAANALDDYEEGTWTPTDASGAGLTLTINTAQYTKIGRSVSVFGYFTFPSTANAAQVVIGGLPFTTLNNHYATGALSTGAAQTAFARCNSLATSLNLWKISGTSALTNADLSAQFAIFSLTYFTT